MCDKGPTASTIQIRKIEGKSPNSQLPKRFMYSNKQSCLIDLMRKMNTETHREMQQDRQTDRQTDSGWGQVMLQCVSASSSELSFHALVVAT